MRHIIVINIVASKPQVYPILLLSPDEKDYDFCAAENRNKNLQIERWQMELLHLLGINQSKHCMFDNHN